MEWTTATFFVRAATHGLIALLIFHFITVRNLRPARWIFVAFLTSLMAYLVVDAVEYRLSIWFFFLLIGPFALPTLFWLLSHAMFEDHFVLTIKHNLILFATIITHFGVFWLKNGWGLSPEDPSLLVAGFMSQLISFGFVAAALFSIYQGRNSDLLEERLSFRKQLVLAVTAFMTLTLFAEVITFQKAVPAILDFLHKSGILLLTAFFTFKILQIRPQFLKEMAEAPARKETPPDFLGELTSIMEKRKFYCEEGLTIGQLARELGVQEYKLRRAINHHLGFRNFNDFLNQYRVQEACEILLDPKQKEMTILEIAYHLGYRSLGPFNAAFKAHTAVTPTAYRKAHLTT